MTKLIALLSSSVIALTGYVSGIYSNLTNNTPPKQEIITNITHDPNISSTESGIVNVLPSPTISIKQSTPSAQKSDQPVHCPVDSKCGGGTKPLKKSECSVAICCQVKLDTWELILGKEKCVKEQEANSFIPRELMTASVALKSVNQDKKYRCVDSKVEAIHTQDAVVEKMPNNNCVCPSTKDVMEGCANACRDIRPVMECYNKCVEDKRCKCLDSLDDKKAAIRSTQVLMNLVKQYCYEE